MLDSYGGKLCTDYDGSSDWASRGAGLTGAVDSKVGTMSFWVNLDDTTLRYIFGCENASFANLLIGGSSNFSLTCWSADSTVALQHISSLALLSVSTWYHVLWSWDTSASRSTLYVNNALNTATSTTYANKTIDWTRANFFIGDHTAPSAFKLDGRLSQFYLNIEEELDLSVTANRLRFVRGTTKPGILGTRGQYGTGRVPIIYSPRGGNVNLGYGGAFAANGTLDLAAGPLA